MKKWFKNDKFIEMTTEELKELSTEEVKEYYSDFTKNLIDTANEKNAEQIESLKSEIEAIKKANEEADIKGMEQNVLGLQTAIKNLSNFEQKVEALKSISEQLDEQKDFLSNAENFKTRKSFELNLETKDITTTDITDSPYRNLDPNISSLARKYPTFTGFFKTLTFTGDTFAYVDYDDATVTNAAAAIAEGTDFPQSEIGWIGKEVKLQKIGDTAKVSDEMLRHYSALTAYIKTFIDENVLDKINTDLYTGNGTAPNIWGLYTLVPAFNHAAYSGAKVSNANLIDLAKVLRNEIMKGKGKKFTPDFMFVSNDDFLALELAKDANGIPLFDLIAKNLSIKIMPSAYVNANTAVIGDSRMAKILNNKKLIVELGYDDGDFISDMYTMKIRRYLNFLIKESEKAGFLKVTDVTAALLAITTP